MVQPEATKPEIRKAVERLYGVHVAKVNIVNRPPKPKRMGALWSKRGAYSKAVVTVHKGETIDIAK